MTDLMPPILAVPVRDPFAALESTLTVLDHLNGDLCACGAEKPAGDFECESCFIAEDARMKRLEDQ